ncbi:MAG: metallophosphoesterase, partial [Planctomycetes bacterium]|nr:metallophosphoesterase [Planctomycetota bacterium]
RYTVNGGPEITTNEVFRETEFNDLRGTVARIKVPGSFTVPPNPPQVNDPLPPDAQISYQVFIEASKPFEDDAQVLTAPSRFDVPFSFWAFGNSGLVGTAGSTPCFPVSCNPALHQSNLAAVLANPALPAAFAIAAGDMVIRNNSYTPTSSAKAAIEPPLTVESVDHRFYNPYAASAARVPFFVSAGDEDLEVWSDEFDLAGIERDWDFIAAYVMPESVFNVGVDPMTEQWYSFDHGMAHIAVIRSSWFHEHGTHAIGSLLSSPDVQDFLKHDLACTNKRWKIVVVHHPPYTSSTTNLDGIGGEDDNQFRTTLETAFGGFEDLGADLVISAHEKFFELTHAVRMTPQGAVEVVQQGPFFTDPGAPVYLITGGGGENLYQSVGTIQSFTMVRLRQHHVTRITVDADVLTIQPFNESGVAIDINGAAAGTASTVTKSTTLRFRRGDSNRDKKVDLADAVFSLAALFQGGPQPHCLDAADADDTGVFDITDPVFTLNHLFQGGPPQPPPGPDGCGTDPTSDDLTCLDYPICIECDCADADDNDLDDLLDCEDDDCTGNPVCTP